MWKIISVVILLIVLFVGIFLILKSNKENLPEIVAINEMEDFATECSVKKVSLNDEIKKSFEIKWQKISVSVEKQVTNEMLQKISRWAKENMKNYSISPGWIKKLPMTALMTDEKEKYVLFSQETEKGFPLPSHHPIVFRRLMVAAIYDLEKQNIDKVFVTIRGWKEE